MFIMLHRITKSTCPGNHSYLYKLRKFICVSLLCLRELDTADKAGEQKFDLVGKNLHLGTRSNPLVLLVVRLLLVVLPLSVPLER